MANSLTKSEEKTWAMATHLSALSGLIFPLGLILGPLLVWLFKRNESNLVDKNGKEAMNFQATVLASSFILVVLSAAIKLFMLVAMLIGIAPGIVVGRLQHDKYLGFNQCNDLKVKYEWV